jgi:hypothetical protein
VVRNDLAQRNGEPELISIGGEEGGFSAPIRPRGEIAAEGEPDRDLPQVGCVAMAFHGQEVEGMSAAPTIARTGWGAGPFPAP